MRATIKNIRIFPVERVLRTTFATSLGKKNTAKSIIINVSLQNGARGTGEVPTSFAVPYETMERIKAALKQMTSDLQGKEIDGYERFIACARKKYDNMPMTVSGLETALFRTYLVNKGIDEVRYWKSNRKSIETDITIPFCMDTGVLKKWILRAVKQKFNIYKLKVSGSLAADKRIISFVFDFLSDYRSGAVVRLDGNQGYDTKSFREILEYLKFKRYMPELFEQPMKKKDIKGMKEAKKMSGIPIVLDETVFTPDDLKMAIDEDLCGGINIKMAKSGIKWSQELYETAKKNGLKTMIGCMTETMTGLSNGIFFASGKQFEYIDLDAIHFMEHGKNYGCINITGPKYRIG
ncbi:MAG TPA: enolase C-terminal domain-like protein [Candidatus Omnitrophota bacterium]|nr:enolase C-terminal domain-like protein [Candidatus Omnitrophota bacterium]HPS19685.1 enolase C-terminal domain-like protein [Candidatus Omnitrophota bacterium]